MNQLQPRDAIHQQGADLAGRFAPFATKMHHAGRPAAQRAFHYYYAQLVQGATGSISSAEAQPVLDLPVADDLDRYRPAGVAALERLVVIKLNGGLGTSMGMAGAKSLVSVKKDLTFLEIIVRQILHVRQTYATRVPLVLVNSFNTQSASRTALATYPTLAQDVPLDFLLATVLKTSWSIWMGVTTVCWRSCTPTFPLGRRPW